MIDTALADFRRKLCSEIEIEQEGDDRFIVYTPFMFDDGDHFVVLLKRDNGKWWLTDEGHTLMHMEYSGVDFNSPLRWRVIENALANHCIQNVDGELKTPLPEPFSGNRLFSFMQGLSRITNVTAITREMSHSAFMEDFRATMAALIPESNREFDWIDNERDPEGNYSVDCMVRTSGSRPWYIFGVGSDDKCNLTSLTCRTFESWHADFRSLVVFRDQTEISRKPLARLSSIVDKQIASLDERELIGRFIRREIIPVIATKA